MQIVVIIRSTPWGEKWVGYVNRVIYKAVAAVILSIALGARAQAAVTINFDPPEGMPAGDLPVSLEAMGNSPGSAVPSGSELSNQYDSDGVLFSSSSPFVAVVDIGGAAPALPTASVA